MEPDLDGKPEDGESDIDQSDFEHDGGCIHMDDLVCDDVSPDHEHGDDCYDWGYVDQNGWEHNEDCIKIPYKPGVFDDNDFGMDAEPGDLDTSLLVDPDEIDYLGTGSPERVDAAPVAANYQDLPATGGLGIGMILLTSMSGIILISNAKKSRVEPFARSVKAKYTYKARKPKPKAYRAAMRSCRTRPKQAIYIGDQIFTDMLGANRAGVISCLVNPISPNEGFEIRIKRPLERLVMKLLIRLSGFVCILRFDGSREWLHAAFFGVGY